MLLINLYKRLLPHISFNIETGVFHEQWTVKPVYKEHPWDPKKWQLFKSGCYSEVGPKNYHKYWKAEDHAGHCRQVVIVQRWLLTQVTISLLYKMIDFLLCKNILTTLLYFLKKGWGLSFNWSYFKVHFSSSNFVL